ncbi:MAG TPA: selenocysteine-specific translation elongation factor [Candidatus Polarisedimenticolaceae bacterium]|nr:selenocysteine-specific translation elongation factor [Candidatus Polarisedimenticolaceae bacterium]
MRHLVVGTAGHIDHGKSALVEALTGVHPDRLKEEKRRGITIDLGFADLDLEDDGVIGFVDVPGHERFVRHMVAGASGLDAVLLVIAADDGVKPQTREHLAIASLLGVAAGLVVITKADLAEPDLREVVAMETRELTAGTFLEDAPIVAVSARTGEGLPALRDALRSWLRKLPPRAAAGVARLPIDRSFVLKGFGTVVTGTLVSGALAEGDEIEILPRHRRGRIRGLQVHKRQVSRVLAGSRVAVNVQGLDRAESPRGATLAHPETLLTTRRARVAVTFLAGAPARLRRGGAVRFHQGTCERAALLRGLKADDRGASVGEITFREDTVLLPGDRFILRRPAPVDTIGGGVVLDAHPAGSRAAAAPSTGEGAWVARIAAAGVAGKTLESIAAELGATLEDTERTAVSLASAGHLVRAGALLFAAPVWSDLGARVAGELAAFHAREPLRPGMTRETLRAAVARAMPGEAFRHLLESLALEKVLVLSGDRVAGAGFRVVLSPADAAGIAHIESAFRNAGLDPPAADEILRATPGQNGSRLLGLLVERGVLVKIRDGRLFHTEALEGMRLKLREFARTSGTIDVGAFKELAGVTRKNAIPLLEQLDAERLTRREGNVRKILIDQAAS